MVKVTGLVAVVKRRKEKERKERRGRKKGEKRKEKFKSSCKIFIFRPPNAVCILKAIIHGRFPFVAHPSNFDQNLSFAIYYTKYCSHENVYRF